MLRAVQYWIPVFFFFAALLLPFHACAGGKEKKIDSLKKALPGQTDTTRIKTLIKLSQAYQGVDKDSALKYALLLKAEAEAGDSLSRVCDAYVIIGTCFNHLNQEDSAMYYKRRAYETGKKANYPKGVSNAANDIGLYMKEYGDFDSATYYILESIEIREANGIEKPLGVSYTNLGFIYQSNGDTGNAMIAYRKASELASKYSDYRVLTAAMNNMAAVFDEMKKVDSAMYYYVKVMALCDSIDDAEGKSRAMLNIGVVYRDKGELVTAEKYFLEAMQIKDSVGDTEGLAICAIDLADNYRLMKRYDLSERYLVQADTLALRLRQKEIQRDVYLVYSRLYRETGRTAQALEYFEKYYQVNKELLDEEKVRAMEEMRTRFGVVKKERENAQLREEQRLSDAARVEEARQRKILIGGLIALAVVLLMAAYAYRIKIKSNLLLEVKNEQISKQNNTLKELNKKLIESEEELTQLNATKDELLAIISHDLGNPVNAIVNYNTVLRSQKETLTKEEMAQSLDKVNLTLQPLQGFLDNLLHWSILQRNGIVVRKEEVNVKEVIAEIVALYNASLLTKRVTVQTEVSPSLSAHADRNILRLILRNLVGNAVKFSPPGATVHIKATSQNNRVVLEVRNSGAVIPADKIAQILEGKRVSSSRGSLEEQGTGLGLSLVSQYVKAMEGILEIESGEKTTTVRIAL